MIPQARRDDLLVQEVGDELVLYDLERHRAHRLNPPAALVWRHCDGRTTVAQLAGLLHRELDVPDDEQVVWLALHRLQKSRLLVESPEISAALAGLSRRSLLRAAGLTTAAVLLPAVRTVAAPTPAMAQTAVSCSGLGGVCISATQCQGGTNLGKLDCGGGATVICCKF